MQGSVDSCRAFDIVFMKLQRLDPNALLPNQNQRQTVDEILKMWRGIRIPLHPVARIRDNARDRGIRGYGIGNKG